MAGKLALWLALLAFVAGCANENAGPSAAQTSSRRVGGCFDDSAAPPKWRRPETAGLALSPSVLHAGDRFQADRRRHPRRTSYGLQLIALDGPRPCSEIFHLVYDGSGRTWGARAEFRQLPGAKAHDGGSGDTRDRSARGFAWPVRSVHQRE